MIKTSSAIISVPSDADESESAPDFESDVESRSGQFGPDAHGRRIDLALLDLAPEFSRSYLQQRIEAGDVLLNSRLVQRCSTRVKAGDLVDISLRPTPQSQAFKAEHLALDIVFEDAHILVVNKPAGMVVHPAPGHWSGTLMNAILGRDEAAFDVPRAGIVHRLDKDTSGLMVLARSRAIMDILVRSIAERAIKRQYLALVHGTWRLASALSIDKVIGRDPAHRLRMSVVDPNLHPGKSARTDVELLDTQAQASLLGCALHTGRTHQIRVHLASLGYPLLGDTVYGGRAAAGLHRQALHARHLAFAHPVSGNWMRFSAGIPEDIQSAIGVLGLKYNGAEF